MGRMGFLLPLLLTGCMTTIPQRTPSNWQRQNLEEHIQTAAVEVIKNPVSEEQRFAVEKLHLQTSPEIVVEYYRVKGEKERPLVVMSPMLGGDYALERIFLSYFANNGMDAALVHRRSMTKLFRTSPNIAEDMETEMRETVVQYKQVLDVLLQQPNIRPDQVCGFGISFGGMKNTVIAAKDPRLRYNVLLLAGSLDKTVTSEGVAKLLNEEVERWLKQYGGKQGFVDALNAHVQLQPQYFASGLDPDRTLLFIARYDDVVPRNASEELRKNAGYPRTVYMVGGHYSSILYAYPVPFVQRKAMKFFKEKIATDQNTGAD